MDSGSGPRTYDSLWEDSSHSRYIVSWGNRSGLSVVGSFFTILLNAGSECIVVAMDVLYVMAPFPTVGTAGNLGTFLLRPTLVNCPVSIGLGSPFRLGKRTRGIALSPQTECRSR